MSERLAIKASGPLPTVGESVVLPELDPSEPTEVRTAPASPSAEQTEVVHPAGEKIGTVKGLEAEEISHDTY